MGVRITDSENVALYDSTSGIAFGPIFRDESEAEDFLAWLRYNGHEDARALTPAQMAAVHPQFVNDAEAWGNDETADDLTLVEWLERMAG